MLSRACVLVLLPCTAVASDLFACSLPLSEVSAKEALTKVQDNYNQSRTLHAKFIQNSFLAALDDTQISSGTVWFMRPGKMRWDYQEPEQQIFLMRDKRIWLYQKEHKQVITDDASNVLISDLPIAFLLGVGSLNKDFLVRSSCKNEEGVVFELAPSAESKKGELSSFWLLASAGDSSIKAARVQDLAGNMTTISLSDLKRNSDNVTEAVFNPDFPSDADRIERGAMQG